MTPAVSEGGGEALEEVTSFIFSLIQAPILKNCLHPLVGQWLGVGVGNLSRCLICPLKLPDHLAMPRPGDARARLLP